ncbi:hypothetical protein MKW94_006706 [Papaver nudicaule]|uniref:Uncharacterized protein n=1 Tax=Papaver nudicaule TaxID=74823 RepID=A0AA42ARQ7_PAPNU|nr:hypothetical protein [Papaver nudicaule]
MLSKFLFCILLFFFLTISSVKAKIGFDCKSISKCQSLAGYVSPNATTLSEIATLFKVTDINYFLGANSLPIGTSLTKSVAAMETIRIPFACSCKNGSGIADDTTMYKVKEGEGLDHIARNIFSM